MKRTGMRIVKGKNGPHGQEWLADCLVTCELTGQMDTGENVWTDIETGEQYFLTRLKGRYMFYHI